MEDKDWLRHHLLFWAYLPCAFLCAFKCALQEKFDNKHIYAHKLPMARPKKKIFKESTNLTLSKKLKEEAMNYAYENNLSLSELVTNLLEREIKVSRGDSKKKFLKRRVFPHHYKALV